MNLSNIRQKLIHGMPPLTLAEQRALYLLATGEVIVSRKRCPCCDAYGMVRGEETCGRCNGSGYLEVNQ